MLSVDIAKDTVDPQPHVPECEVVPYQRGILGSLGLK